MSIQSFPIGWGTNNKTILKIKQYFGWEPKTIHVSNKSNRNQKSYCDVMEFCFWSLIEMESF